MLQNQVEEAARLLCGARNSQPLAELPPLDPSRTAITVTEDGKPFADSTSGAAPATRSPLLSTLPI